MKKLVKNDENFLKEYTEKVLKNCLIDNNINSVKFKISVIINEHESIKLESVQVDRRELEIEIDECEGEGYKQFDDRKSGFALFHNGSFLKFISGSDYMSITSHCAHGNKKKKYH